MLRDEISSLMCEAFTANDALRWGRLAEYYADKLDTIELKIHNLTFNILGQVFANDVVPVTECTNVEGIVSAAYDLAMLTLASRPAK